MTLSALLQHLGIAQADLRRATGLSRSAISRLVAHGEWPVRAAHKARQGIDAYLVERGLTPMQLAACRAALAASPKKLAPVGSHPTEAAPEVPTVETETPEEILMLLPKSTLSMAARKQFALPFVSPFDGDVNSDAEMFMNGETRFVREAAWQAALGGRFLALVGESGAGKTTMLDGLKFQVRKERKAMVFIEPDVQGMEESDSTGKTIKITGLHAAIILTLDPNANVPQAAEQRMRKVKKMLAESTMAGNSHLLVIEEAHALPVPTLRHLKRLNEAMRIEGSGGQYHKHMLGVLLLGHPELEKKLNRFDVREVMQRCDVVRLCPLGADLSAYLQFRAANAGRELGDFISPDGVDELRTRLTVHAGGQDAPISLLYPLNVNNWMVAALNTAADLGAPRVDRDVIRAV